MWWIDLLTACPKWRLDGPGLSGHVFVITYKSSLYKCLQPSSSPIIGQRYFDGAVRLSYFNKTSIKWYINSAGQRNERFVARSIWVTCVRQSKTSHTVAVRSSYCHSWTLHWNDLATVSYLEAAIESQLALVACVSASSLIPCYITLLCCVMYCGTIGQKNLVVMNN